MLGDFAYSYNLLRKNVILSFKNFMFMDVFAVKINKVTGSDVIVGTLLERSSVCNRIVYVFLIIS